MISYQINTFFFKDSSTIKNWGDTYSEYFDLKKEESFKSYSNGNNLLPYAVFEWYSGFTYLKINPHLRGFCIERDSSYATDRIRVMEDEINQFRLNPNSALEKKH